MRLNPEAGDGCASGELRLDKGEHLLPRLFGLQEEVFQAQLSEDENGHWIEELAREI
jgi:hypothetical protein